MPEIKNTVTYSDSGVNYDKLDSFKRMAQGAASETSSLMTIPGFRVVEGSRGEPSFIWEEPDSYRSIVVEGLGTKNLVADAIREESGKTYYDVIAQDTVATIINDLITSGATPLVISMYVAAGNSEWFVDKDLAKDLLVNGWKKACFEAGVVWGGGESPSLKGIIVDGASDIGGAGVGIIKPKERLALGDKIKVGDNIVLIESNGIHANGLTWARDIAAANRRGYKAELSSGMTFGKALLKPTYIYANLQKQLYESGVDIHYMVNITGHGWRKLMRANYDFTYFMYTVPPVPEEMEFIQKERRASNAAMYDTFNMGAGFAFIVDSKESDSVQSIAKELGYESWNAGVVKEGPKQVIIEPKGITYSRDTLSLR
ncbi:MAG TPA: AIR synthase-related protein [Patescibacteria group bacterium]